MSWSTGLLFIMSFWIRNAIFAVVLIGLAVAFFLYKDVLLSSVQEEQQISSDETSKEGALKTGTSPKPKLKVKSSNAAAEGLSSFYAKIYGEKKERKIRNNIIYLPDPQGDIIEILQARKKVVRPYRKDWQGTEASRSFRKGETLYQKLSEYASSDGLEVLWWINKDFIVKDAFRIEKNILKTAHLIGQAVSGHFQEGITSYFCYRQRTLVFINEPPSYFSDECILLE